jgi:hypothetical protein
MDKKHDNKKDEFYCEQCNKKYKTYKTLWEHNKKYHINDYSQLSTNVNTLSTLLSTNVNILSTNSTNKMFSCSFCNKEFNQRQGKHRHELTCKKNQDKIDAENKQQELKLAILKQEKDILQLKLKLQNSTKVDNMTLNQLNKKLMERNNLIKNSNNILNNQSNNVNSNNSVVNNINLVGFGKEDIIELLTNNEKRLIVNAKFNCLEKIVEIVHCGNYGQFKNIIITNMKDNYLYTYDEKKGHFILSNKSEALNTLIDNRVSDLDIIYNELLKKNKLDDKTKTIIEKFINKINVSEDKYIDFDGKEHQSYKQYKINEIKLLLYNNKDKVTENMALLLTTNEIPNNTQSNNNSNVIIEEVI